MPVKTTKYIPVLPDSYRANAAAMAEQLGIVKAARDLGQRNEPPTSAQAPTPIEERIVNTIREKTNSLRATLRKALQQSGAQLETMKPAGFDFDGEVARLENKLRDVATNNKLEVRRKIDTFQLASQNLRRFRTDNNIWEPAIYSKSRAWPTFGLLAVLVLESLVGINLFKDVINDPGQLIVLAFLLPGINMMLAAVLCGIGVRLIRHVNQTRRMWGWVTTAATLTPLVVISAVCAYCREFYLRFTENNAEARPQSFSENGLLTYIPNDLEALLLFFAGVAIPVLCAIVEFTGTPWSFASQYPGYRGATEAEAEAYNNACAAFADFKADVKDVFEDHRAGPGRELQEGQKRCKAMRELTNELNALAQDVGNEAGKWSACGHELLNVFRTENRQMRPASSPPPAYFGDYPDLSPLADVAEECAAINEMCNTAIAAVETFESEYRAFTGKLEAAKGKVLDDISGQYEIAVSDAMAAAGEETDFRKAAPPEMSEPANNDAPVHLRRAS